MMHAPPLRRGLLALALATVPAAAQIQIPPVLVLTAKANHILRRTSFGPTLPTLIQLSTGDPAIAAYLNDQLQLLGTEDPRVNSLLGPITPPATLDGLKQHQVVRACFSVFQLREVMTQFWERHFNTSYGRIQQVVTSQVFNGTTQDAVAIEYEENELFRQHALGTFHDLLLASAHGRAMILYLNLWTSKDPTPNEDYAREVLELHTVGPEDATGQANYDHDDIEAVAACFSGWNVYRSSLPVPPLPPLTQVFVPTWHVAGTKDLFGAPGPLPPLHVPDRGQTPLAEQDGFDVLWHLANLDATKDFVCRKLIAFFLSDEAVEPALLTSCKSAWGNNGGDINAVLATILGSPEFQGQAYRFDRLKMPMETVVGVVRALHGDAPSLANLNQVIHTMDTMGQDLFGYPSPDGFPMESLEQPGTQIYVDSVNYVQGILRNYPVYAAMPVYTLPADVIAGIANIVPNGNPDNPAHVAQYFLRRLYVDAYTPGDLIRLTEFVSSDIFGNPMPLDHVNAFNDYAQRINLLAGLAVVIPQGLKK